MGLFGPPNVIKMKAKKNLKGLIKALAYQREYDSRTDPIPGAAHVRELAAQALGEIGDSQAAEALIAALDDEFFSVTSAVTLALGQLDTAAVKILVTSLGNPKYRVRQAAGEALSKIGKPAMESLIIAAKDANLEMRANAVKILGEIGNPCAGECLRSALNDSNSDVRENAVLALGQIRDAQAIEPLLNALKDTDHKVRANAAIALGQIGDLQAVALLINTLQEKDNDLRDNAAKALGQIGDSRAVTPLTTTLKTAYRCLPAAEALDQLGWKPENSEVDTWYWVTKQEWSKAAAIGPLAVDALFTALDKEKNVKVSSEIVESLIQIKDQRVVDHLIALLTHQHPDLFLTVVNSLGQIGDARAVEPLAATLQNSSHLIYLVTGKKSLTHNHEQAKFYAMQQAIAKALIRIGAPSFNTLLTLLEHKDVTVQHTALKALVELGDHRSLNQFVALLTDKHKRKLAVQGLANIGEPAIQYFISELKNKSKDTRLNAADTLDELGWKPGNDETGAVYWKIRERWDCCIQIGVPAVDVLIATLKDHEENTSVRSGAAEALGQIGDNRPVDTLVDFLKDPILSGVVSKALVRIGNPAIESLITALRDKDEFVRQAAVNTLGVIGVTQVVEPLIVSLQDKNESVRRETVEALGKIGDARAVEPLIAALQDKEKGVRSAAIEALVRIGDTRAVEPLIAVLQDEDRFIRRDAATALGQIGNKKAVNNLIRLLKDEYKDSRLAAISSLARIKDQRAIPPLIAILRSSDEWTSIRAGDALDELGWKPDQGEDGAYYWVIRKKWDKCVKIGEAAVPALISALPDSDAITSLGKIGNLLAIKSLIALLSKSAWSTRVTIVNALVELYQSGRLTDIESRTLILSQQKKITQQHTDYKKHYSNGNSSDCNSHTDYDEHHDTGIGLDFPI